MHNFLHLGPVDQVAVVVPVGDYADAANDATRIGKDFAGGGRNVIAAAGAHGFNRGHDGLFLLLADTLHFLVDFLGSGHAAAGRIDVQDDGLDGVVTGELLEFGDHGLRLDDHALEIDDADLVAEPSEGLISLALPQAYVNQSEDRQHEEKKSSAADNDPQQSAGFSLFWHGERLV